MPKSLATYLIPGSSTSYQISEISYYYIEYQIYLSHIEITAYYVATTTLLIDERVCRAQPNRPNFVSLHVLRMSALSNRAAESDHPLEVRTRYM